MKISAGFSLGRRVLAPIVVFFLFLIPGGIVAQELAIPYEVEFEGVEGGLRDDLSAVSDTVAFKEKAPATIGRLRRRVEDDIPRFIELLQAQGYYGSKADFRIDEDAAPVVVAFIIDSGPAYPLKSVTIKSGDDPRDVRGNMPAVTELGLEVGAAARAQAILDARETLVNKMRERGFPFVEVDEPKVVVDHGAQDVSVTFPVAVGPSARFGATTFSGQESVDKKLLRSKLPWREGEPFNAGLFDELRNRLTETRLFSLVKITHADELDDKGLLPIAVDLRERKHRTVSAGASYYTDEGAGGKIAWEHRNLFRGGERLSFEAKASGLGVEGKASFRKPAFLRDDQSLILNSRLGEDDTDAYTSRSTEVGLILEREPKKGLRFGAGPAFRLARVDQQPGGEVRMEDFALVSFPSYLNWDASNDLLNPVRGGRLSLQLTPFVDTLEENVTFLKGYSSYTHYFKLLDRPSLVLAGRGALGFIAGTDLDSIPADLRFYAGGGGSIRGYPFQSVGPLDGDNPTGGRSLLELGTELRINITEKIGLVAFLDGGSAFEPTYPDFNETVLWGAGAGFRYFTPVGPLRLDIGFPLNPRENVDEPFQVYVSIGQAF